LATLKQVIVILVIGILVALVANFLNKDGISITDDGARYDKSAPDKTAKDYSINPYDTTHNNQPASLEKPPNISKEGFVKPQNISLAIAKMLYDKNAIFFDARPKNQYDSGHIKNAISLPYQEFNGLSPEDRIKYMSKFNKDASIVCYCSGGECEVSIDLAFDVAKTGFNYVNIYRGGYPEWKDAGYPTNKDQ
jgi:rhodanese-related sulfurtransferase